MLVYPSIFKSRGKAIIYFHDGMLTHLMHSWFIRNMIAKMVCVRVWHMKRVTDKCNNLVVVIKLVSFMAKVVKYIVLQTDVYSMVKMEMQKWGNCNFRFWPRLWAPY